MKEVLIHSTVAYLLMGVLWVLHNAWSTLAREDRARWRRDRQYWRFVWVPVVVALAWPICAWLVLRIRKAMRTGQFDRIAREIEDEHRKKGHGESR